jgi:endonuclease YncB( thermonuclease family)
LRGATWIVALVLFVPLAGYPETFQGKVIRVKDGDSILVLVGKDEVEVRLAEIDAPERKGGQPWSKRATQALAELVSGRVVEIRSTFNDRYGRRVGYVRCSGHDVNRALVRAGHAWVFRRWMRDETLLEDEAHARAGRLGLWSLSEADRVPPWDWREGVRVPSVPLRAMPADEKLDCGSKRYCREMVSCAEARFYLEECHLRRLDGDGDGVPCESVCRSTE